MRPRTPCSQEATSRQRRLETDTTVSHPQHVVLKPVRKQATQRGHRTSQVCQSSVACLIFAPPTPHRHKGNSNCTLTAPPACINKLARVLRNDPLMTQSAHPPVDAEPTCRAPRITESPRRQVLQAERRRLATPSEQRCGLRPDTNTDYAEATVGCSVSP